MSINPINRGHVLVVPIAELDHWIDLEPPLAQHLMSVSRTIGRAQQAAFSPERIGLMIAGFEVPHVHIHVIPMDSMAHLSFANAAASVTPDELRVAADAIAAKL
jgi:histidine triad (HIT) family protein